MENVMRTWNTQDANTKFDEFLGACLTDGPQMMTNLGVETAILVSVQEWRLLQSETRSSLKQLLLSNSGRTELTTPKRGQAKR